MFNCAIKDKERVEFLIAKTGNTRKSFAQNIGISHYYLYRILSGERNPSPKIAGTIAENLEVDMEEIFYLKRV